MWSLPRVYLYIKLPLPILLTYHFLPISGVGALFVRARNHFKIRCMLSTNMVHGNFIRLFQTNIAPGELYPLKRNGYSSDRSYIR